MTVMSTDILDAITKTITKTDSKISEGELEKTLIDVLKEGIKEFEKINP
jgi:hypothetical protein